MKKPATPSANTAELDAYREGHNAGFKLGIAEGKRALRRELKKQAIGDPLRQFMESQDEKLVGNITFCECPPPWMTPAQQLIRHGWIERAKELQEAGRTQVVQAGPEDCPPCNYVVQAADRGLEALMAAEVLALTRYDMCMGVSDAEEVPPYLAFRCQHCRGSRTHWAFFEPHAYSEATLGIECQDCGQHTAVTLGVDHCGAHSLLLRKLTAADVAQAKASRTTVKPSD